MLIKEMTAGRTVNMKCLCSKAEVINCANGTTALFLSLKTKDDTFVGKLWDVPSAGTLATEYSDKVLNIVGVINTYRGANEVKISRIGVVDEPISNYIPTLDIDALLNDFSKFLKEHLSENYFTMIKLIFNSIDFDKFAMGYAATSHHDNISGGLINHTLKMLRIAEVVLDNLPDLKTMSDRIYSGIVLHDIGKIWCYSSTGSTTDLIYVDHKAFGVELLGQHKDEIINLISEDEYYQLVAIILGHHGEYGEPCHSVATLIVHKIDALDAKMTEVVQKLKEVTDPKGSIQIDGMWLHI